MTPELKSTNVGPEVVVDAVYRQIHNFLALLPNLVMCAVFLLFVWGLAFLVRRLVAKGGHKSHLSTPLTRALSRLASIVVWILGFFTAATIVIPSFNPGNMIAGLGISSIAIGFAFKDIFQNFLAGLLLLWSQPFKVGDQIQSSAFEGTVEDIDIRATLIKTSEGELVILPNSMVYTNPIVVKTAFPSRRGKVEIQIEDKDGAIEEVGPQIEKILQDTAGVLDEPAPRVQITDLKGSAIHFTVFFWSEEVGEVRDRLMLNLQQAFDGAVVQK